MSKASAATAAHTESGRGYEGHFEQLGDSPQEGIRP